MELRPVGNLCTNRNDEINCRGKQACPCCKCSSRPNCDRGSLRALAQLPVNAESRHTGNTCLCFDGCMNKALEYFGAFLWNAADPEAVHLEGAWLSGIIPPSAKCSLRGAQAANDVKPILDRELQSLVHHVSPLHISVQALMPLRERTSSTLHRLRA